LTIVAAYDLGEVGAAEGRPVSVSWRWYDSKPTLPLWILLGVLLLIPPQNRNWQAWLILTLPLATAALRWVVPSDSADIDLLLQLIVSLAIAWSCAWLLMPYLAGGGRLRSIARVLAVLFAVGAVAFVSYFGFWCSAQEPAMAIGFWVATCTSLLLAMLVSGMCCGGRFHPALFTVWLLLFLPLVNAICVAGIFTLMTPLVVGVADPIILVSMFVSAAFISLFVSGILFALNLPVILLAMGTACYRERLEALVCRPPQAEASLLASVSAGGNPFEHDSQP